MSERVEHSPSPWKALLNYGLIVDHRDLTVAQLWGKDEEDFNRPETTKANARLIAESPTLYELAREVAKEECHTSGTFRECSPCPPCKARAIVARIEGER